MSTAHTAYVPSPAGTPAFHASLRATPGLVRHPTEGFHWVARYDDVRDAAMRTEDFSSRIVDVLLRDLPFGRLLAPLLAHVGPADVLAVADAPQHRIHRKLSTPHFARESVAAVIERFRPIIDRRLDAFVARGGGDFIENVAAPIPIEIALSLLGFPIEDAPDVKRWVDDSVVLLAGTFPKGRRVACVRSALALYAYADSSLAQAHRRGGTGAPLGDALTRAWSQKTDLRARDAASIVMQVLSAGSDSTTSLLGNAAVMLARMPELIDSLRAEPSLTPSFLEECLRLESPFPGHARVVRRTTELAGTRLVAGDRLMLLWASANRDPTVFDEPDAIRLVSRRGTKPHFAFGHGSHLCLGAGLARGLAREVIDGLIDRTTALELAPPGPNVRETPYLRTHTRVPLAVKSRSGAPRGSAAHGAPRSA